MLEEKQYIDIIQRLTEISADVKGVHRRQDITNGRLAKNEEKVIDMDKAQVSILAKIDAIVQKDTARDAADEKDKEKKDDNKQFWFRLWGERLLWIILALATLVLSKTGIININGL